MTLVSRGTKDFYFNYKNTLLLIEHWSELLLYSVFVDCCFEVYIYNRDNILRVLNQCIFILCNS